MYDLEIALLGTCPVCVHAGGAAYIVSPAFINPTVLEGCTGRAVPAAVRASWRLTIRRSKAEIHTPPRGEHALPMHMLNMSCTEQMESTPPIKRLVNG